MGEGNLNQIKREKKRRINSEVILPSEKKGRSERSRPEMRLIRRKNIEQIKSREGILEYLENLIATTIDEQAKKKAAIYLRRVKDVLEDGKSLNVIDSEALRDKVREILELKEADAKNKKDNAVKPEQLFDAMGISDKSFPDEATAGREEELAPGEELEVGSLGVEVIPPEEGEEIRPEAIGPEKDSKPKKPEEGPEEKEKKARERQERLAQLKVEIDQARKEYLEDEYQKTKSYARLGNFFGKIRSILKDDSGEARDEYKRKKIEEDSDLAQYRAYYDNKLFEYKNLLLEDAKERGVSNKELGDLVKVFAVEANLSMADTHTEVKIKHHEGTTREFLADKIQKSVEWYKKLPLYQKIAVGAVFGLASAGTVATGAYAAYAGYVALGVGGRRIFLGMVTGVGTASRLEKKDRKKSERKIEEMSNSLSEGLEGRSEEERLRITQEIIKKLIYDEDQKIEKIKNRNIRNLAMGAGFGTLVGSSHHWMEMLKETEIGKEIFGSIHGGVHRLMEYFNSQPGVSIEGTGAADITDNNPEYPGYQDDLKSSLGGVKIPAGVGADNSVAPAGPSAVSAETPSAAGVESRAGAPVGPVAENPVADAGENTILKVEGVSGREGAIIKYLNNHPEAVEKYNELPGNGGFDSKQIAHRIAVDYANEKGIPFERLNEAFPGQELELSPDGTKIMDVEISGDEYQGDVPEDGVPESTGEEVSEASQGEVETDNSETDSAEEAAGSEAETSPEEQPTAPQAEQVPAEKAESVIAAPKEVMIEEFKLDDANAVKISSLNGRINDLNGKISAFNGEIGEIDSQINHIAIGAKPTGDLPGRPGMTIDELVSEKERLTKSMAEKIADRKSLIDKRDITYIISIREYMTGTDRGIDWEQIRNVPASQLVQDKKGLVFKFFAKISRENVANFKGNINPGPGELLTDWVTRVVKIRTR